MMNKKQPLYKTLARALSMKRPAHSEGERVFADWLHTHMPKRSHIAVHYDKVGNLHVDARTDPTNRTLFIAHMDTVHRETGPNKIRKTQGTWYADGACLGADDGAGCAILMHLLHAGVPAYFIFSVAEEKGGIGAKYLADSTPELLAQFDRAIAFDRRGIDSVITHQGYGRCCSDEFAASLSDALCADGVLMYLGDDTGVYTDTAEFTDIIPECTNISVGYNMEHSDKETLDIFHFVALAAAVVKINWDELPTARDPNTVEQPKYETVSWSTAFDNTKWDGAWLDGDEYNNYTDNDMVEDFIRDAMRGMPHDLMDLIAETAYPEDPALALKFLNKRLLTDERLYDALKDLAIYDAETVLLSLFDKVHCEA